MYLYLWELRQKFCMNQCPIKGRTVLAVVNTPSSSITNVILQLGFKKPSERKWDVVRKKSQNEYIGE